LLVETPGSGWIRKKFLLDATTQKNQQARKEW
jgi:hypothetical protein